MSVAAGRLSPLECMNHYRVSDRSLSRADMCGAG